MGDLRQVYECDLERTVQVHGNLDSFTTSAATPTDYSDITTSDPAKWPNKELRARFEALMNKIALHISTHQRMKTITNEEFETLGFAFDDDGLTDAALTYIRRYLARHTDGHATLEPWNRDYFDDCMQRAFARVPAEFLLMRYRSLRTKIIISHTRSPLERVDA